MRTALCVAVFFVLACGGMGTAPTGPMAEMADRFSGFDCSAASSDPDRSWCPAAAAGHGPFTPPEPTAIRMGLTLAVRPGEDPRDAVKGWLSTQTGDLHPLTLGADGGTFQGLYRSAIIQRIEGDPWGAAYVVFEDGPDGAFISVFPDSELAVLPE